MHRVETEGDLEFNTGVPWCWDGEGRYMGVVTARKSALHPQRDSVVGAAVVIQIIYSFSLA